MRITPGKIIKVTTTLNVLGYTWIEVDAILGHGLWASKSGRATIEVPGGEIWKSYGCYFTTSYNTYPIALSIVLIVSRGDALYGYTGGTVTFPAHTPLQGLLWVPFTELVLTPGTYTIDYKYQVVYGRKGNMTFFSRMLFERLKA